MHLNFDSKQDNFVVWFAITKDLAVQLGMPHDDAVITDNTVSLTNRSIKDSPAVCCTRLQRSATAFPGRYLSNFSEMAVWHHLLKPV